MLILPFRIAKKVIEDTLMDDHGKWHSLKMMRNMLFGVGIYLILFDPNPESRWMACILLGMGTHGVKDFSTFWSRKTADGNGQPLMQENTEKAPDAPVVPAKEENLPL